jgi:SAM-dependent methyltransferase
VTPGAGVQGRSEVGQVRIGEVYWPLFENLAHSFWRAQELTLFVRHKHLLEPPVLDLGCGDGIFGRLAGFPPATIGVDYDVASLVAREAGDARVGVRADASRLPFRSASIATCVSNSVLEHLPDLETCLAEVSRVVRPGGRFIFSLTLGAFTTQLTRCTGPRDSARWIRRFGHLQQPDLPALHQMLVDAGWRIDELIPYQPQSVTGRYRWLVSPATQFVHRHRPSTRNHRLQHRLAAEVWASITSTAPHEAACAFLVVSRSP